MISEEKLDAMKRLRKEFDELREISFTSQALICVDLVNEWKERAKTSDFFKQAVECWTIRDVQKIKTAKENNLNYKVFYDYTELYNIINENKELL